MRVLRRVSPTVPVPGTLKLPVIYASGLRELMVMGPPSKFARIAVPVRPCPEGSLDPFLNKLKGVTDPEKKRKIIGNEFIAVFDEEAQYFRQHRWVPSPGGPIFSGDTLKVLGEKAPPEDSLLIGRVIGTDIPSLRPWTRAECARLVQEAGNQMEIVTAGPSADAMYQALQQEFAPEIEGFIVIFKLCRDGVVAHELFDVRCALPH